MHIYLWQMYPPNSKLSVPGQSTMLSMTPHSKQSINKMNYGRSIYIYNAHIPMADVPPPIWNCQCQVSPIYTMHIYLWQMYCPPNSKLSVPGQSTMLSMTLHSKWSIHKINYGRPIYISQCTYFSLSLSLSLCVCLSLLVSLTLCNLLFIGKYANLISWILPFMCFHHFTSLSVYFSFCLSLFLSLSCSISLSSLCNVQLIGKYADLIWWI